MAVDIFLKLDGIKGESKDGKHKDDDRSPVLVLGHVAVRHAPHRAAAPAPARSPFRTCTSRTTIDKASPEPDAALRQRQAHQEGQADRPQGGRAAAGIPDTITMEDILVSHSTTGGSHGEDRSTENVLAQLRQDRRSKYKPQKPDGTARRRTPRRATTFKAEQVSLIACCSRSKRRG